MIARSSRTPTQTRSRETLREVCGESTGETAPRGAAFDVLEAPYPGEPIRNRPKLPLVDAAPGEATSLDIVCEDVEPESFPGPQGPGSACTQLPRVLVPQRHGLITGREATVGEIFRRYGGRYFVENEHRLRPEQKQVLKELTLCRTEELGWSEFECDDCGRRHRIFNPCRNRHCPQCEAHVRGAWVARHRPDLLDVSYWHIVLTTPHEINVLAADHRNLRALYGAVFWAGRNAIFDAVRYDSKMRAETGILMVFHSWSQRLNLHLHLHILLPAVGWSLADRKRLLTTNDREWLSEDTLIQRFRELLVTELSRARTRGKSIYQGDHSKPRLHMTYRAAFLADDGRWQTWANGLKGRKWQGQCEAPELTALQTLKYLGNYAQKAAIGNSRIEEIDLQDQTVRFRYRDNHGPDHHWGSIERETIPALEFIDRFLLHVMPYRMTRVRKYGWWSPGKKAHELPRIRKALGMREPETEPADSGEGDMPEEDDEHEETIRIVCKECRRLTMVRVVHYPKPSIHRIMRWAVWPECSPDADQMVLPAVEPYLPGGTQFFEALGFT